MSDIRTIPIDEIRIDGGTQMRVALDDAVVSDYGQTIREGIDLPPIVIFFDGTSCWLGDGFHRLHGYRHAGATEIDAEVRKGTKRDAILFSVGANASHGLRRSNADKRKAVETLLRDDEWGSWSDREIGRQCAVDHKTVARIRDDHLGNSPDSRTAERNGVEYQINTAAIGKSEPAAPRTDEAKAAQQAQQAEHDRQRDEAKARLPEAVQQSNAAREAAIAAKRSAPAAVDEGGDDRVDEMEQTIRHLHESIDALQADGRKFETMRVQWEQGGFEKVVAGKDEEIRVLKIQVEVESADKAAWARTAKRLQKLLQETGYSKDIVIDPKTGAMSNG